MKQFRLSLSAEADLAQILETSGERWGAEGMRRYAALLAAGMLKVAAEPAGPTTRNRSEIPGGVRSFHLRNARAAGSEKVKGPVHVLYYRAIGPDLVEIVRILHERMDPSRHLHAMLGDEWPQ
jgi:toxin ParE1/3/4